MNIINLLKKVNYKGLLEVIIWLALNWDEVSKVYTRATELIRLAGRKYQDNESRTEWFNAQMKEFMYEFGIKLKKPEFWINLLRELALGSMVHESEISETEVHFEADNQPSKSKATSK